MMNRIEKTRVKMLPFFKSINKKVHFTLQNGLAIIPTHIKKAPFSEYHLLITTQIDAWQWQIDQMAKRDLYLEKQKAPDYASKFHDWISNISSWMGLQIHVYETRQMFKFMCLRLDKYSYLPLFRLSYSTNVDHCFTTRYGINGLLILTFPRVWLRTSWCRIILLTTQKLSKD